MSRVLRLNLGISLFLLIMLIISTHWIKIRKTVIEVMDKWQQGNQNVCKKYLYPVLLPSPTKVLFALLGFTVLKQTSVLLCSMFFTKSAYFKNV
jgi:hypothetical protein